MCENPVVTFPIMKRISIELFIDRTASPLYIEETRIRVVTMEGDERVDTCLLIDWRSG